MPTRPSFLDQDTYERARRSIFDQRLEDGLSSLRFPNLLDDGLKSLRRSAFGDENATSWTPTPAPLPIVVSDRPEFMETPRQPEPAAMPTTYNQGGVQPSGDVPTVPDAASSGSPAAPASTPGGQPAAMPQASAGPSGYAPSSGRGAAGVEQWSDLIAEAAREYGVPEAHIKGLMEIESGGRTHDDQGRPLRSAAGAASLMQVMPFHFAPGEDMDDPRTNIRKGVKVYADALQRYGDPDKAAAAYFGAIDDAGNITSATDATGTDGHKYVALWRAASAKYGGTPDSQPAQTRQAAPPATPDQRDETMVTVQMPNSTETMRVPRYMVGEGPGKYAPSQGWRVVGDPRTSLTAGPAEPAGAQAAAGSGTPPAPGSGSPDQAMWSPSKVVHSRVLQAFQAANGRMPSPDEAHELASLGYGIA